MAAMTTEEACIILKEAYLGINKIISIKLQTLRKQFDNLSRKKNKSIQVFFNRATVNNINILGDTIDDKKVVEKVLRSLPPKFDHIVATREESKNLSKLSVTELMESSQARGEIA